MIDSNILGAFPQVMRDWFNSFGPVEDIQDVEISRDCIALESDGGWKSYLPSAFLKVKVVIPPLEHCCMFVQFQGEWMKEDEDTGKNETVTKKKELNDSDSFDLMDNIRNELWK